MFIPLASSLMLQSVYIGLYQLWGFVLIYVWISILHALTIKYKIAR